MRLFILITGGDRPDPQNFNHEPSLFGESNPTSRSQQLWRLRLLWALVVGVCFCCADRTGAASSSGLWVGEVNLNQVNEAVVGFNAASQVVAPDPALPTPTASAAHLRILLHVDSAGQVRLLKGVAVLPKGTNQPGAVALVTDPTLYPAFSSSAVGRRVATASFDFGDGNAVEILDEVAMAAAVAAASGGNATNAANQIVQGANIDATYSAFVRGTIFNNGAFGAAASASIGAAMAQATNGNAQQVLNAALGAASNDARVVTARTNALALQAAALLPDTRYLAAVNLIITAAGDAAAASASGGQTNTALIGLAATNAVLVAITNAINAPSPTSPDYRSFVAASTFQSSAGIAAAAATAAAAQAVGASQTDKQNQANAAALKALTDSQIFSAADAVTANEVLLSGSLAPGGTLTGRIYLGASHPTNPFRHRRHPDHTLGYPISRALTVQFDASSSTNALVTSGFGVDRITGTYREEILGLHKPLGPAQDIGLITAGVLVLDRISPVDTLNQ